MASVLTKFLIGIGWQTDDFEKGERNINTGLENVKTKITTTGSAIAGAMIGLGKSVINTAGEINTLALSTTTLYTSARDVKNFGFALRGVGGDAGAAVVEIRNAEEALAELRSRGEAGVFGGKLQTAGIDITPLMKVESGAEFMAELSKQIPTLTKEKKILVQTTLGLSPATIELLSKGEDEYNRILKHVDSIAGLTPELIANSKELNAALAETQLRWDGIYNTMAVKVMPILSEMSKKTSEWLTDTVKPIVEQHPVEMAVGGSLVAAGAASGAAGAGLSMLGMGAAGAAAGAAALPVAAVGAGIMAWDMDEKDVEKLTGVKLPKMLFEPVDDLYSDVFGGIDKKIDGWFSSTNVPENDKQQSWKDKFIEREHSQQPSWRDTMTQGLQNTMYAPLPHQVEVQLKSSNLPPIQNNITVQLDGGAIENKVREISERQAMNTEADLKSTTAR